jgi:predicted Fe-S protein YdhL (DUF1289 family)
MGGSPAICLRPDAPYGAATNRPFPDMAAVETPCIQVCTIDSASRLCVGCGRTLDEIAQWLSLSAAERRRIMDELPQRIASMRRCGAPAA